MLISIHLHLIKTINFLFATIFCILIQSVTTPTWTERVNLVHIPPPKGSTTYTNCKFTTFTTNTVAPNRVTTITYITGGTGEEPNSVMAKVVVFAVLIVGCLGGKIQRDLPAGFLIEDVQDQVETQQLKSIADLAANVSDEYRDDLPQPEGRVLYVGSQLWKTVVDSEEKANVLASLREDDDITIWGGNTTAIDILVDRASIEKVRKILTKENINFDVAIQDLQQAIDEENPVEDEDDTFENRNGHRLTWTSYHRLADHHGYLDFLAETHPNLVTLHTIGNSVGGRPIKLVKISNGKPGNRAVWVDGGIHAREWITPAAVTYLINHLINNWEDEPKYIQNTDFYIAPLLNPDGYEYTHTVDRLWRKNRKGGGRCAGVDLNRNFGYRWGGQGSSKNSCAETYGGASAFSEPETSAVQRFISTSNAKWRAYVSFHSYGQYILYPWGYGRVVPPDYKDLENVGQKAAQAIRASGGPSYTVGPAGNTLYPAAGGSDDWAKGTMKIKYAYTIELRDNGRYGFVLPASYIQPTAREALAALRVIVEAANRA